MLCGDGSMITYRFDENGKLASQSRSEPFFDPQVDHLKTGAAELGDTWGLVAAAVALLFLKPLQAFAERVVSLVMPNTENTEEYKAGRKLKVYTEAVAEAHAEGGISDKERALLVLLRDSLGVSEATAAAVEAELTSSTPQAA